MRKTKKTPIVRSNYPFFYIKSSFRGNETARFGRVDAITGAFHNAPAPKIIIMKRVTCSNCTFGSVCRFRAVRALGA